MTSTSSDDKLLDAFGILVELQSRIVEKQTASFESLGDLRRDMQDLRTDILQMRTALQQIHQDFVKVAYLLSNPPKSLPLASQKDSAFKE
jgi:hypothetical protein